MMMMMLTKITNKLTIVNKKKKAQTIRNQLIYLQKI